MGRVSSRGMPTCPSRHEFLQESELPELLLVPPIAPLTLCPAPFRMELCFFVLRTAPRAELPPVERASVPSSASVRFEVPLPAGQTAAGHGESDCELPLLDQTPPPPLSESDIRVVSGSRTTR